MARPSPTSNSRLPGARPQSSRIFAASTWCCSSPKANTPGCTQEGQDFRDAHGAFSARDTRILGASRDGLKAQENFQTKHSFPFELISDKEEALCKLFDVIKLKKMYGKESLGVERSTFLIDKEGVLRREWRKVKVKGHADEVLAAVQEIA